ncbi:hypothetical protein [Streptomyces mirabilis]|uniref:hypothetical protein n=1 Tax=Streptomyces mirabilis TaxID=68239 RepID=UPI00364B1FC7
MGGLLTELGKKLAERWLTLLAVPGALYLAAVTAAISLDHAHPFALTRLTHRVDELGRGAQAHGPAGLAVLLIAALLASAAIGLAAQAAGSLIERQWLGTDWLGWPDLLRRYARSRVQRRRRRWNNANIEYQREDAAYQRERERAAARRALAHSAARSDMPVQPGEERAVARRRLLRISVDLPTTPTWMGDRLESVVHRIHRDLNVELAIVWPSLWLTAPDTIRGEITVAREALTRATTMAGWGTLYLLVGLVWWPGLLIAAITLITAWRRGRASTEEYALLVEATVRLQAPELARILGLIEQTQEFTQETGGRLTCALDGSDDRASTTQPRSDS